ncbi:MAG TPA: hypothetical protein VGD94_21715 [Vicinamibacterales bacterium]
MASTSERRIGPDRRKAPRGGRRPGDREGFTPLVLVVGDGRDPQRESEAILRECRFAVAPAVDVPEALRVVDAVHPDLIVAQAQDAPRLRQSGLPVVEYTGDDPSDGDLIERLRRAIRARR